MHFLVPVLFYLKNLRSDGTNLSFGFLHEKPCRIIMKLRQQIIFETETRELGPKVGTWTCPSCPKSHKSVIPHQKYKLFSVPPRPRPGPKGREGLAMPSRARPGGARDTRENSVRMFSDLPILFFLFCCNKSDLKFLTRSLDRSVSSHADWNRKSVKRSHGDPSGDAGGCKVAYRLATYV